MGGLQSNKPKIFFKRLCRWAWLVLSYTDVLLQHFQVTIAPTFYALKAHCRLQVRFVAAEGATELSLEVREKSFPDGWHQATP